MNKSELKTGMWVELRNGLRGMVLCDVEHILHGKMDYMLLAEDWWIGSYCYTDELIHVFADDKHSVVKVLYDKTGINSNFLTATDYEVLWERNERTYLMDFKEKFPKHCVTSNDTPTLCRNNLYGTKLPCDNNCVACWHMVMK